MTKDRAPPANEYDLALRTQQDTAWSDPAACALWAQTYWPVIEQALTLARNKAPLSTTTDDDQDALDIGRAVVRMIEALNATGRDVGYLAVLPDRKVLALSDKWTPEQEAEILNCLRKQRNLQ